MVRVYMHIYICDTYIYICVYIYTSTLCGHRLWVPRNRTAHMICFDPGALSRSSFLIECAFPRYSTASAVKRSLYSTPLCSTILFSYSNSALPYSSPPYTLLYSTLLYSTSAPAPAPAPASTPRLLYYSILPPREGSGRDGTGRDGCSQENGASLTWLAYRNRLLGPKKDALSEEHRT